LLFDLQYYFINLFPFKAFSTSGTANLIIRKSLDRIWFDFRIVTLILIGINIKQSSYDMIKASISLVWS